MFHSGRITPSLFHHQQLTVSSTTTGRYDLGQLPCLTTRSQPDHLHQHCRISCVYQYSQLKTAERDHFILSTQPGHSFGTTNCAFSTKAAKWRAWLFPLLPVAQPTSSQKHSCDHILLQKTSFFPTTALNQQITTGDSL